MLNIEVETADLPHNGMTITEDGTTVTLIAHPRVNEAVVSYVERYLLHDYVERHVVDELRAHGVVYPDIVGDE